MHTESVNPLMPTVAIWVQLWAPNVRVPGCQKLQIMASPD